LIICLSFSGGQSIENNDPLKKKRIYQTQRLNWKAPKLDGVLSDSCWLEQGSWTSGFRQFMPNNYAAPTRDTEFKILYDNLNIYAAFRCFDDPDSIEIQSSRRDIMKGDIIGIAFDSYHDLRTAYEFDITAAGCKADLSMIDKNFHFNWDAVWYGKVAYEDSAWTAEMKIPFSQLRFPDKTEHIWGLHVWRWIDRNKEEDQWNVFHIDATSWPDNFGELHGIRGLQKKRRIELLPYSLFSQDIYPREAGNPFTDGSDFEYNLGLDGKIGLSSNFTMDFTINPDFGQVEADPSVLNLTAFETFYDEKRPFFLEGKSIFDFTINGNQLFYSRRIGHRPGYSPTLGTNEYAKSPQETTILNALKITGKTQNGLSMGVIQSITAAEKAEIDRAGSRRDVTVEPWSNYFLTRLLKDYNHGNSSVGAMFTSTQRFIAEKDNHLHGLPVNAFTGGFDLLHRWKNRSYFFDVKTIFSHIHGKTQAITDLQRNSRHYYQRPDINHATLDSTRTSLFGFGGSIHAGKSSGGTWHYSEQITWYSPGLDLNDLGYMRLADVLTQKSTLSYHENTPNSIYRRYSLHLDQQSDWDFSGRLLQSSYNFGANLTSQKNWLFYSWMSHNPKRRDTRMLRGGPALTLDGYWNWGFYFRTDSRKKLSYSLKSQYTLVDDDVTRQFSITPAALWRIGTRFNLSGNFSYDYNIDDSQYINTINYNNVERYILGRIEQNTWTLTLRADYAFTPNLILQYYASPFISTGKYSHFKYVTDADADRYERRFHMFTGIEIIEDRENNTLAFDENSNGEIDYSIYNPDFNFYEIRSNLVLRWEFTPGSTFYFVWTHGRSEYINKSVQTFYNNADRLFAVKPQNIFMMKFNYWLSL